MNFTSQICTTREQSERLLALGLKKETADMKHFFDDRDDYSFFHRWKCWPYKWDEESLTDSENIPAWSLHRLIEMYSEHYVCEHINLKLLTYDTIIESIRLDILAGTFNKEYLEQ